MDQQVFLQRIADRLGRSRRSGVTTPHWETHPSQHVAVTATREERVEQFMSSLNGLDVEVARVTSPDAVADQILQWIEESGIRSVVYQDDDRLERLDIPRRLAEKEELETVKWGTDDVSCEERNKSLERIEMGITMADLGLAETGSVILFNGGGKGRMTSLLPPVYVAVIQSSQIVPRLTQALEEIESRKDNLPSCINFITGPSRSADIEMDLSLGVHGPGSVYTVVLEDDLSS